MTVYRGLLALAVVACMATTQAAGTFKQISIDGDYSDWDDVPVLDSDGGDNSSGPDIGVVKIANDGRYLYIYNTAPNGFEISTYTSIDLDQNVTTGYDIFGLGILGADVSWQNDFAFQQAAGTWNIGGLAGNFFGGGHALLDAWGNQTPGPSARELAINLNALFSPSNLPVFTTDTFNILLWTDTGTGADGIPGSLPFDGPDLEGDVTDVFNYTLAVPEPTSIALFGLVLGYFVARRR